MDLPLSLEQIDKMLRQTVELARIGDALGCEVDRLRAELARVTGERDRMFAVVVAGLFEHKMGASRQEGIEAALSGLTSDTLPRPGDSIAVALAEHDRRFTDPNRPAGATSA